MIQTKQKNENESCPTVLQQDPTISANLQYKIKRPKSQQFTRENQMENNQNENNHNRNVVSRHTSEQILSIKQIPKQIHGTGTQFINVQVVQSSEYSINQGSIKSRSQSLSEKQNQIAKRKQRQNKVYNKMSEINEQILNVLVAGATDTGKTTFIKCFKKKQKRLQRPHIRQRTKQLKIQGGIVQGNILNKRNYVSFIDIPGFQSNSQNKYVYQIKKLVFKFLLQFENSKQKDNRIHCCLYFFQGPRIKEIDLKVMNKLSKILTLIPVIGKSDCYTAQQIIEIKEEFKIKTEIQNKIQFLDIENILQCLLQKQQKQKIQNSNFGKIPPFAIAASEQKQINQATNNNQLRQINEANNFIRKYPWGKVQIQNQMHTQFTKLCYLLTDLLKKKIILQTYKISSLQNQLILNRQREQIIEVNIIQKQDKKSSIIKFGAIVLATAFGFYYLGKKLQNG